MIPHVAGEDRGRDVLTVVGMCRDAQECGCLSNGSPCVAQVLASRIASADRARGENSRTRAVVRAMESMTELWLRLEHHEAWESRERAKRDREAEQNVGKFLEADNMMELLAKMRAMGA